MSFTYKYVPFMILEGLLHRLKLICPDAKFTLAFISPCEASEALRNSVLLKVTGL